MVYLYIAKSVSVDLVSSAIKTDLNRYQKPRLISIAPDPEKNSALDSEGRVEIFSNTYSVILLFGLDLNAITKIRLTPSKKGCLLHRSSSPLLILETDQYQLTAKIAIPDNVTFPVNPSNVYYFCFWSNDGGGEKWAHQGNKTWQSISITSSPYYLPIWIQVPIIVILLGASGIFSGLNLGLMSLTLTELEIVKKAGSAKERLYAERIYPLRKRGNLLLCTLLIGNVIVNNSATILLENIVSGLTALLISSAAIVVFGEIIPQAICSRHGLAVGAHTRWLTISFMIVTFPFSYPISVILNYLLGEEMGYGYSKQKLIEFIRIIAEDQVLENDEATIIAGALQLSSKSVNDIMTKMEDVFMIPVGTMLDFDTITNIMSRGFTRIPVYEHELPSHHFRIVGLLLSKDLAAIDPGDNIPVNTIARYYNHQPLFVTCDLKLDAMLREFLQGELNSHCLYSLAYLIPRILCMFISFFYTGFFLSCFYNVRTNIK